MALDKGTIGINMNVENEALNHRIQAFRDYMTANAPALVQTETYYNNNVVEKSQTNAEDSASSRHCEVGCHFVVEHEEAYETIQTLRRRQSSQAHVGAACCGVLLEGTNCCITTNGYAVSTTNSREGYTQCNTQIR